MLHFGLLICKASSRMLCQISQTRAKQYSRKRIAFALQAKGWGGYYNFRLVTLCQRRTKSEHQVARATKFSKMTPNICRYSEWNLLHFTTLTPRILGWRLHFWKILTPQVLGSYILLDDLPLVFRILRNIIRNGSV
jgi:hypothetical protein